MLVYDYECTPCKTVMEIAVHKEDRDKIWCEVCGITMQRLVCAPGVHIFPEGFFEHIANEPIYVNDKPHLKRLTKEHKVYAPGLLDGGDYGKEI